MSAARIHFLPFGPRARTSSSHAYLRRLARLPAPVPAIRRPAQRIDRTLLAENGFIAPEGDRSRLGEEVRAIKQPLLAQAFGANAALSDRVILVSSAGPHEGKSFTAGNLALSLAQEPGLQVVAIDADPNDRGLTRAFGITHDVGLADLLDAVPADPARVFIETDVDRFSFVTPGASDARLTDLVGGRRMNAVVTAMLEAIPRLVLVIDAPPLLTAREGVALARLAGQTLLVVEAGRTLRRAVARAAARLGEDTAVRLVLNKAKPARPLSLPRAAAANDAWPGRPGGAGLRLALFRPPRRET